MTFYTNSTIHMIAHGSWAQVLMLAGGAELGLARGKLHSQYWRLCTVLAMLVSGAALLAHEQQHWLFARAAFLHHLLGWTIVIGAVFPLAAGVPAALGRRRRRLRGDDHRRLGDALLRSRRRAGLRAPLSVYAGVAAPMRRALLLWSCSAALALPASAFAHASVTQRRIPTFRERLAQLAARSRAALRPVGHGAAALDRRAHERREERRAHPRARSRRSARSSRGCRSSRAARTPCAGRRCRTTVTSCPVSTRSAFAFAAPLVTDAVGAQGPTRTEDLVRWVYFLGLALLVGGTGFRLIVVRGPLPARGRASLLLGDGDRRRRRARGGHRRVPASRQRTRCSCRSGGSSTATSRRSPAAPASAWRSSRWSSASRSSRRCSSSRGSPTGVSCSGPCSSPASASRRDSRSRATRRPTPGTPGSPSSPTGCT